MSQADLGGLVHITVKELPVELWERTSEHTQELLREFALIATEVRDESHHHTVPARLTALVAELDGQYGGFGEEQDKQLLEAAAARVASIDLEYDLPPAAADAARHLGDLLDEADAYCQEGRHLLTLAAHRDEADFRRWFLEQFVDQVGGGDPVSWPQWQASRAGTTG